MILLAAIPHACHSSSVFATGFLWGLTNKDFWDKKYLWNCDETDSEHCRFVDKQGGWFVLIFEFWSTGGKVGERAISGAGATKFWRRISPVSRISLDPANLAYIWCSICESGEISPTSEIHVFQCVHQGLPNTPLRLHDTNFSIYIAWCSQFTEKMSHWTDCSHPPQIGSARL